VQLEARKKSLATLFGTFGQQYRVPPYQRPYAWLDEQVDELWNDLMEAGDGGHFMGSVVVATDDEDHPQVIDGQQRLTTLTILLGLIRDRAHALGDAEFASAVQHHLVADSVAAGDARWKLRIGDTNWKVFRDLILVPPGAPNRLDLKTLEGLSKKERAGNERVIANALLLDARLAELLGDVITDDQLRQLRRLHELLVKRLEFVSIEVGSLADAFLLFETLNDRGLALSAADLLKNHLMARSTPEEIAQVGRDWDQLLADLGPAVDVTLFFRHYLLLFHRDARKENVYDLFKEQSRKVGPRALLDDLGQYAKLYGRFANPSLLGAEEADAAEVLTDLNTLRATSCFVLLMPARRYLSSTEFVKLARVCEVFVFRANSVLSANSQQVQDQFKRAARLMADSKGEKLAEVYADFRRAMPEGELFAAAFQRQRLGTQYLAKYMLRKIEDYLAPTSEVKVQRGPKVHLEHVLPQALSDEWRAALPDGGEAHAEYVSRWGNLTLLDPGLNIRAGNRPFEAKRVEAYEKSVLKLNEDLARRASWTYVDIDDRQAALATLADEVWSMDRVLGIAPPPATVERLAVDLPEDLRSIFEARCHETTYDELIDLKVNIEVHVGTVEIEAASRDVDLAAALKIHRALTALIDLGAAMNGAERAALRGAIEYFALSDDASGDFSHRRGFDDDRAVVNAVCDALGLPDLKVT
jgi:hypothetical protein